MHRHTRTHARTRARTHARTHARTRTRDGLSRGADKFEEESVLDLRDFLHKAKAKPIAQLMRKVGYTRADSLVPAYARGRRRPLPLRLRPARNAPLL